MGIQVSIYDPTNVALVGTLSGDYDRQLQDVLNDVGSAKLSVLRDSADAALITQNRVARFVVDGTVRFATRIGPWDQQTVAPGEEIDEQLTVTNGGLLATLKDAVVYPDTHANRLRSDTRFFNFANPDYQLTPQFATWTPAVEQFQQGDVVNSSKGVDAPQDWPDPTAFWLWSALFDYASTPPSPVGDTYYLANVTLAFESDVAFFINGDDGFELWCDGVLLAARTEAFAWRGSPTKVDAFLAAGDHTIGVKGINIDRPSSPATNVGMFIFAMYTTGDGGTLDTLLLHSDSTWKALGYPAHPPGFTAGEILGTLFTERTDRSANWMWHKDFTDATDSLGNNWAERIEISFRVGETYLDVVRKLAETYVDLGVNYVATNLRMVNKGGWNTGAAVSLQTGVHLTELHHAQDPAYTTTLLVHQADGKYVEANSTVVTSSSVPRVEALFEAGSAPSDGSATRMATGLFDKYAVPKVTVTFGMEPVGSTAPWADWWPGKVITLPDRYLNGAQTQVLSISIADRPQSDDGYPAGSFIVTGDGLQGTPS